MKNTLNKYFGYLDSPIGTLKISASEKGITAINFVESNNEEENENSFIRKAKDELELYFLGKLKKFSVKLDLSGSEFQIRVWNELMKIKYGETITYGEISENLGYGKKASRAVGLANNKNKIPIIIPCHRVIGINKKLVGYAGGIDKKRYLLQKEQDFLN